jgi:hypothetical protein
MLGIDQTPVGLLFSATRSADLSQRSHSSHQSANRWILQ